MTSAVQTIRLEHFNIASVLTCLDYLLREIEQGRWEADFELLSSVVEYLESYPEVYHHPKEEDYLFKALLRRRPESKYMLEKVHDEHVEGAQMLARLRGGLEAYRRDGGSFARFKQAATEYIGFERRHMVREERELLPLALKVLHDEDWAEIDEAFARNDDPLFGRSRRREFQRLVDHILELAPSPLGFQEREAAASET